MFGLPEILDALLRGFILAALGLAWVIVLTRMVGLRTFSKMTAFDFMVTLATGSLLATAATGTSWLAVTQALTAIVALLGLQVGLAQLRRTSKTLLRSMENTPLMLMKDGRFIDAALITSRVSREDVLAKIRQSNTLSLDEVRAVVLETTGDISVLSGKSVDPALLDNIRMA